MGTRIVTENKVLRVNIAGNWTSSDFSNLFQSLTLLFQLASEIDLLDFIDIEIYKSKVESKLSKEILNVNGELYKRLNFSSTYENMKNLDTLNFFRHDLYRSQEIDNDLQIKQIVYASPGFADFVGLGKITEQVFALIKYYLPNEKERLQNKNIQMDIISKQIQHMEMVGYSKKEIRKYYDVRDNAILNLQQLHIEKKISEIEIRKM